jgi:hypothetical protein
MADIIFMQDTIALMARSAKSPEQIQELINIGVIKEIVKDEVSFKYLVIKK